MKKIILAMLMVMALSSHLYAATQDFKGSVNGNSIPAFTAGIGVAGQPAATSGVAFPSSVVLDAGPNVLDDYEEGTWEVVITCSSSGGYTMSTNKTASYTKIGRLVHVMGRLSITSEDSPSGNIKFSLPFTIADLTQLAGRGGGQAALWNHGGTLPNGVSVYFDEGGQIFYLMNIADDGTSALINEGNVDTAWDMHFNFSYVTSQ